MATENAQAVSEVEPSADALTTHECDPTSAPLSLAKVLAHQSQPPSRDVDTKRRKKTGSGVDSLDTFQVASRATVTLCSTKRIAGSERLQRTLSRPRRFEIALNHQKRACASLKSTKISVLSKSMKLRHRSDRDLLTDVGALIGSHRELTAKLVAYLGEIEQRRLHLYAGFSSMFEFCTKELRMGEGEAFRRVLAARLARRFPAIFAQCGRKRPSVPAPRQTLPRARISLRIARPRPRMRVGRLASRDPSPRPPAAKFSTGTACSAPSFQQLADAAKLAHSLSSTTPTQGR
jgi:hypothetical protein